MSVTIVRFIALERDLESDGVCGGGDAGYSEVAVRVLWCYREGRLLYKTNTAAGTD